jgi:hypothetical protein
VASAAGARRALGRRAARAVAIAQRKRRDSHRSYPDLLQTHRLAIGASIADVTAAFADSTLPLTFRFRCNPTAGATGVVLQLGSSTHVGFSAGELEVQVNGWIFRAPFAGEPRSECEIAVAFKPVEAKVRAWVDSDCVISGLAPPAGFAWGSSGSVDYDSTPGAQVLDDVDFYYKQLPRHVDECPDSTPATPATCPILYNAAIATNIATEHFPFLCIN